jgi:phosphoglycerate dehydrogenase-like enzyme
MALLLFQTRDLKFLNEQMKVGFRRGESRLPQIELRGKTALIIGLGGIGTQVAERAFAFGMRILAVDPKDIPYMRAVEYCGKPDELRTLLPEADVVISCVPFTEPSYRMLGAAEFDLMKDGVYVINVSRGRIVDTEALTAALKSGKVRAAGLDVTDPEPLPLEHPLWSMPNVLITPHNATVSDNLNERRIDLFRENIERFVTGRMLRNVVDKQRGY